jgi:YfiH family protein
MMFSRREKDGIIYYTSTLLDSYSIPHMFAASRGGVSVGDFSSLNVSLARKNRQGGFDRVDNVSQNLSRSLGILGFATSGCTMMKQIHSSRVCRAELSFCEDFDAYECDGVFADGKDGISSLCVKTADCVPVLLYELNNNIACAIHAGWRGTVSDICGNAVRTISSQYDNCRFVAAIGPHARKCCYEVDDKVFLAAKEGFEKGGIESSLLNECFSQPYFLDGKERYKADLSKINRIFLENAGVAGEDIDDISLCTCCFEDENGPLFFSHRQSGGFSGTQPSIICVKRI